MLAGAERGDRLRGVEPHRRGHDHGVYRRGEQLLVLPAAQPDIVPLGDGVEHGRVGLADGGHLDAGRRAETGDERGAALADYPDAQLRHVPHTTVMAALDQVRTLTFDVFGTILDLGGSLTPHLARFLKKKRSGVAAAELWAHYRHRQRIEQYQDTIMALGHPGYRDSARRALMYVLRAAKVPFEDDEIDELMGMWLMLRPFPDALDGLRRLRGRYGLVVLSNGEPEFLAHLVEHRIGFDFDAVLSVSQVGAFKPHPGVYRLTLRELGAEPPELLMVSSNSFDVMGARSCGLRGAYVDRYGLPYEETPFQPDLTVKDFAGLAERLGA